MTNLLLQKHPDLREYLTPTTRTYTITDIDGNMVEAWLLTSTGWQDITEQELLKEQIRKAKEELSKYEHTLTT